MDRLELLPINSERSRKYPYAAIVALIAGAFIATVGTVHAFTYQATSCLYASAQVSATRNVMTLQPQTQHSRLRADLRAPSTSYLSSANAAQVAEISSTTQAHQQAGMLAAVGIVMGVVGAWCMYKRPQKRSSVNWNIAAASASTTDPLPSLDMLLAARQEFLRQQGKGPGPDLAPGEVLRTVVTMPGSDEPVDLLDLYKRFDELLGESVPTTVVGQRIEGTVFDIDERGISVDFGGKSIGFCPAEEIALFKVRHPEEVVQVGQKREFEVILPANARKAKDDPMTYLSLKRIQEEIAWKRLQQYRENEVPFDVILKGKNRGGYMVEVEELCVPGFLPKSQATSDLATAPETADPSTYMDQVVGVKVLDLDSERRRLVVSQRLAGPKSVSETFKVGTVHEGIIQNVKPYGVFVDVNGMSGLLHISQISHNRIENVDQIFKVGDKIKCMVLSQDPIQGRLALSTKRLEPTHGDMLTNQQLVYEKAEEMAERFRADIAAAEKRMQEFEQRLAEQNTVAFG